MSIHQTKREPSIKKVIMVVILVYAAMYLLWQKSESDANPPATTPAAYEEILQQKVYAKAYEEGEAARLQDSIQRFKRSFAKIREINLRREERKQTVINKFDLKERFGDLWD